MKTENQNCLSCQAMRNRLISIAKGCIHIEQLNDRNKCDEHEGCFERDLVLRSIYEIATGKHNWPEARPYDPVTEEELNIEEFSCKVCKNAIWLEGIQNWICTKMPNVDNILHWVLTKTIHKECPLSHKEKMENRI